MEELQKAALRAVIYARVSTDDQADKGYSLPSQLDLCRKYAERLGFTVVGELREDHSGATPIAERPEGKKLAALLKTRQADAVIIYHVDRLSRDIVNLLATVQMWIRSGVEVHTCDIGKIESELDIVLVIKGWQGSDERKKILERTMRGKPAKAESGRVVVCGRAPYGYAYLRDDKRKVLSFEIIEEEARIVRLIYHWYVHGEESGHLLSATKIAARLSAMRVATPGETRNGFHRTRGAGMWNIPGVLSIIQNEVYAGRWRFNWRIGRTKTKRPLEETIAVNVPAIVECETWERAQVQRGRTKELSRRNAKHDYLLRGSIRCQCGRTMTGTFPNHRRHYACNWWFTHHTGVEKRTCFEKYVRADAIEADIWEEIEKLFEDLDRLWRHLKAAQQEEVEIQEPRRAELEAIEASIRHTEKQAAELAATLPRTDLDGIVGKKLKIDIDQTNTLYRDQVAQRDRLIAELGERELTDERITEIMQYARDVREGVQNPGYGAKRRTLESLHVRVTVKEGRYHLKCLLGKTEGAIRKIPRKNSVVQASCSRSL